MTTMAIVARRKGYELPAVTAAVEKHMTTEGPRRIARIVTRLTIPLAADHADRAILEAALLKFRPVNMDVLPLYIVLLAGFPPIVWLLLRKADLALGAAVELLRLSGPADSWFSKCGMASRGRGPTATPRMRMRSVPLVPGVVAQP